MIPVPRIMRIKLGGRGGDTGEEILEYCLFASFLLFSEIFSDWMVDGSSYLFTGKEEEKMDLMGAQKND